MALNPVALSPQLTLVLSNINQSMLPARIEEFLANDYIFSKRVTSWIICVYALLAFTGITSNLSIIAVIVMHPKLQTGSNLLVLNLNISDLGVSLVVAPLTLINVLRRNWTLGNTFCRMAPTVQGLEIFVSALTISSIALDRMLRITNHSLLTTMRHGTRSVLVTTVVIWMAAFLLSLPVALNSSVITVGDPQIFVLTKCVETWTQTYRTAYTCVTLVTQLLVPTATLFICYLKISSHLKQQAARVVELSLTPPPTRRPNTPNVSELHASASNSCMPIPVPRLVQMVNNRNRKALLVLIAIWLSFTFTWLPWNLFNVYVDLVPQISLEAHEFNSLFLVCHLLAMSSATSNAILYGWFNTNIRNELIASAKKCAASIIEAIIRLLAIPTRVAVVVI